MTALVWLRHDLRLRDNPALFKAAALEEGVVAVYVHCDAYVRLHDQSAAQRDFIRRHLHILRTDLAELNIPLLVSRLEKPAQIAPEILHLAQSLNAGHCFFNAEYPVNELNRDMAVNQLLREQGIAVKRCHDRCIVPPGMVRNGQGEPYKVFTAFKKKWLHTVMPLSLTPLDLPLCQAADPAVNGCTPEAIDQLFSAHELRDLSVLWPAGEQEAYARLDEFIAHSLTGYLDQRDYPAIEGTSTLSPYFAVGSLSPRQALSAVLAYTYGDWSGNAGAACWISELIWREFYQHVVVDYPQVCKRKAMQAHTEAFPWQKDTGLFDAWCKGMTGIPIVDAAMRQLNTTGWMHNRLRMIVAMFLTKNCQIDWRWGEQYFMSQLIDGDFAANNGGWQWSASTGTDAAPYFRIFNPCSQSERFDPTGEFIRKWVPEIAHLSTKDIHSPPLQSGYPRPIVDLSESRKATIALFKNLQPYTTT
ncbi:deoxyribodipyrimidine photo-lyase [Cellvibrio sp. PSBB023]|uniref:cryptochrome/photolyase family protein n=1 Tax=Cellvibrio sp. PSBB023 TaxID=1945512 RepID=UPI00098F7CA8|nr:deoxyribodipyrimidine photo-lyase [Cellvibrio sp. PSBB023]AQT59479.1 deoxyribodipyrimidine photolyase [Cellvibrio sp. PSBB023]